MGLLRTVLHYQPKVDDSALKQRLSELAGECRRFDYRRLHILLEREDFEANHKRNPPLVSPSGARCSSPEKARTGGAGTPAFGKATGAEPRLVDGVCVRCPG